MRGRRLSRHRLLGIWGLTHLGALELAQGGSYYLADTAVAPGGDAPSDEHA